MEPTRFDATTRQLQARFSRRAALQGGGAALAAAALSTTVRQVGAQPATPAAGEGCPQTTEAENRSIVQKYFDAINAGDIDAAAALLAPATILDTNAFGKVAGREQFKSQQRQVVAAFPDRHYQIDQWLTQDDYVAVLGSNTATHLGDYKGIPASKKKFTMRFFSIFQLRCGYIVADWREADELGLLEQIGALPNVMGEAAASTPASTVIASTSPAAGSASCPTTSEAQNVMTVLRYFDEVYSHGNFDLLDDLFAPDYSHHPSAHQPDRDRPAKEASIHMWRTAFPDIRVYPDLVLAQGDLVAIRLKTEGTHKGAFMGKAPTGKPMSITAHELFRIESGKIADEWSEQDSVGLFQQLGLIDPFPVNTSATPAAS